MGKIREWQRRYRPADSILFLFEHGDAEQGPFRDWLSRMLDAGAGILPPMFIPKQTHLDGIPKYCLPLQAADLIAYETNKMITDLIVSAKTRIRESMFRLIPPERAPINAYFDGGHIMAVARAWRVGTRQARPKASHVRRRGDVRVGLPARLSAWGPRFTAA